MKKAYRTYGTLLSKGTFALWGLKKQKSREKS